MSPSADSRSRPFPWLCFRCRTHTVSPVVGPYTISVKHDGTVYPLHLPAFNVPQCSNCGEKIISHDADEQINNALRAQLRLLTPGEISEGISKLGLKQKEFAERLGVAQETVSRWVNSLMIQSRAMDNLMRVFFAVPAVREMLTGRHPVPEDQPLSGERLTVPT